jgi:alkylation response protein AidB-like acyl-CoA dehydrogenase
MVPAGTPGVTRRKLATMGHKLGDTGELFFDNALVPVGNLVGREGGAFKLLKKTMAFDRMQICVRALAAAESAFALTLEHVRQRRLFGQRLVEFQNTQFALGQMETELAVARAFVEKLIGKYCRGTLSDSDAAMAKIWLPEMEFRVLDQCLQLWGGSGWMDENDISRMFTAARLHRIYGGASELMKAQLGRRYLKGGLE